MSEFNDPTRLLFPRIKITAHSDVNMRDIVGSLVLPYDASNMNASFSNNICDNEILGGQSSRNELTITFVLDDSTYSNLVAFALPNMLIPDSVDKTVTKLIELLHTPNKPDTNTGPNYILLKPMDMPLIDSPGGGFKGRLLNMTIKNELVTLKGNRVKAKVECTFKESLPPKNENG
jgi:hypothetical protein